MSLKDLFSDLSSVVKEVINASAMSPQSKTDLHSKLSDVVSKAEAIGSDVATAAEQEVTDLPAEASGAAEVVVEKAGALGGPVGSAVAEMAAPVAGAEAAQVAGQFLSVIQAHNKSLEADLGNIIAGLTGGKKST